MRNASSAIDQPIPKSLIHRDRTARTIHSNGPGSLIFGFRREVETQSDAELALLSIRVLLQFGSTQITSRINVRRLDRLSYNSAYGLGDMLVKETSDTVVVHAVTERALLVSKINLSTPDHVAKVAAQSSNMERMN